MMRSWRLIVIGLLLLPSLAQTDEPASAQMLKCSRWIDTQQSDCNVVQTEPNTTVAISRLDWDERQRRMATVGNDG